jgi:hypothetical protein
MRTRLQIDVQGRTFGFATSLLERDDFGVFNPVEGMSAEADYISPVVNDHCPNIGIGRSQPDSGARKL